MNGIHHNLDTAVHGLVARIVEALSPRHIVICTNTEVHPLTAHGIYHASERDLFEDLRWISRLHEEGGLHLVGSLPGPRWQPPRKLTHDYGYVRRKGRDTKPFLGDLQAMVDRIRASEDALGQRDVDVGAPPRAPPRAPVPRAPTHSPIQTTRRRARIPSTHSMRRTSTCLPESREDTWLANVAGTFSNRRRLSMKPTCGLLRAGRTFRCQSHSSWESFLVRWREH